MSITNSTNRINLVGDGVTVTFPFNFLLFDAADMVVFVDGVQKTIVTDYTIPAAGINNPAGGNVVFVVAPPNLKSVVLLRVVVATQPAVYPVGGKFPSATHERVVDRLTMLVQQIIETLNRTFKLGAASLQTGTAVSDLVALKHIRVNPTATGLDMVDAPAGTVSFPITTAQGGLGADVSAPAAEGDLLVRNAGLVFARLAKGATSAVLQAGATTLSWVTDLALATTAFLGWSDAKLFRGGADIIEQRNGASPQEQRWYKSFTDAANYARGYLRFVGNILEIGQEKAGSGVNGDVRIKAGASFTLLLEGNGGGFNLNPHAVPTSDNAIDAGSPGVRWRDLYLGGAIKQTTTALGLKSVQVFTAGGTWNRPTGIRRVLVEVVGGGGGGGSVNAVATRHGGGGGGGGYARKLIDVSAISSSTITVGAGGNGGAAGNNAGAAGGNSSWADGTNTVTANGGNGGPAPGNSLGGAGGTSSGGDINLTGQTGGVAQINVNVSTSQGGSSHLGAGGAPPPADTGGQPGQSYGGAGSGAVNYGTTADRAGGNGAAGVVIVYEYE